MTPMRQAFVTALRLVEDVNQQVDRLKINHWLHETMDRARDAEEAGVAAQFAAASNIYLNARRGGDPVDSATAGLAFEITTQQLIAAMLIRRGRIKDATSPVSIRETS